jgi:hypothetical protein
MGTPNDFFFFFLKFKSLIPHVVSMKSMSVSRKVCSIKAGSARKQPGDIRTRVKVAKKCNHDNNIKKDKQIDKTFRDFSPPVLEKKNGYCIRTELLEPSFCF